MGVGLRRVAEKMRQATGFGEKNFQRTSNQRNETMMKEATDFASHLKKCEKAIAEMKTACEHMLSTTKVAMAAPLPRLFEDTAGVSGSETKPVESIGGAGFQSETVGRLSQTASAQIESQVLVPIKRWLDVFNALHGRMKEVEALRLEVDSRRHTVIDLAASVDKLRAKLGKVGGHDAKLEASLDDTIKKLQHKEGKLTLSVQSFQEKEQSLYSDLSTLIKDAAWLRHYIASALRVQGEALTGGASALGDTTRPDSLSMSTLSLGSKGTDSGKASPVGGMDPGRASNQSHPASEPASAQTKKVAPAPEPSSPSQNNASQQKSAAAEGASNPFLSSGVISE